MRLISLNLWGGRAYGELESFLEREKDGTDIFCFQEVLDYTQGEPDLDSSEAKRMHHPSSFKEVADLYPRLVRILDGFDGSLSEPYSSGMERLATFSKKGTKASTRIMQAHPPFQVDVHGKPYTVSSIMQHTEIELANDLYSVFNIHGLWQGSTKHDTPERIEQSKQIVRALEGAGGLRILCGDLNLLPDAESIMIIENGMRNLIREYGITSTRSRLYTKELRYADYVFVSENLKVRGFEVLDEEVSDHLPLALDFS
ncbi:MAG: endonuclease/exonuclease/phosphatase family protein [Candidatus Micrarchaeota archaeon]|nr:endonuclease/exonuclease/phosphatase family protein [Candidatus Micrarchaeota archaeon]MDE1804250.1 endonuclease/exonuclease/phosphatase family protein [Candidatus Micrarchaeota archaeon]